MSNVPSNAIRVFTHHRLVYELVDGRVEVLPDGKTLRVWSEAEDQTFKHGEWHAAGTGILCGGHIDDDPDACERCKISEEVSE